MATPETSVEPPAPTAPSPRASRGWIGGIVLILVAVVLLVVALLSSWWGYSVSTSDPVLGEQTVDFNFGLSEVTSEVTSAVINVSISISYAELGELNPTARDLGAVFNNTSLLLIVSIVVAIVALVVGILAGLRRVPNIAALAVGVVAAILILVTALYFFAALPPVIESSGLFTGGMPTPDGFFGSAMEASWGPGLGWIFAIVAFVLGLVGSVVFFGTKRLAPAAA